MIACDEIRRRGGRNNVIKRTLIALHLLQTCRPTLVQLAAAMGCCTRTARRYVECIELERPIVRYGQHYRLREP